MDRDSFRKAKKNMANTRRYQMKTGGVRQRCPGCGVRMTRSEATELGRCADCNAALERMIGEAVDAEIASKLGGGDTPPPAS